MRQRALRCSGDAPIVVIRVVGAASNTQVMRVFISSVLAGLEEERDSLPGLIAAAGHECVRFEDFGAQPTPSREACARGVESSEVYVLLLGPRYGHVFPETGQSATHDEWVAATTAGMPLRSWKARSRSASFSRSAKSPVLITLRWTMERKISPWLSQLTWIARCIRQVVGQAACIRWMERAPLCEEPLSTTQDTRRAEA